MHVTRDLSPEVRVICKLFVLGREISFPEVLSRFYIKAKTLPIYKAT